MNSKNARKPPSTNASAPVAPRRAARTRRRASRADLLDERPEDRLLVREVVVERARGEVGAADDVAHADGVVAVLGEDARRGGEDRGAVGGLRALAPARSPVPSRARLHAQDAGAWIRIGGGQGGGRRRVAARAPAAIEVAVVHRPRYDDWSLPEGQARPGRELGGGRAARGRGGDRLPLPARARAPADLLPDHKGRAKVVRYWLMEPEEGEFDAQRRGRRAALADPLRRRRAAQLRARPRARGGPRVNRDRFPGLADGWARLDGPGGTQMVDVAIDAMTDWMRSGRTANEGGAFPHAQRHRRDRRVARGRGRRAARRRRARGRLRAEHDRAHDGLLGRRRARAAARRRDRLHAPGPRRQRAPVADRGRARGRDACASPSPSRSTLELPASAVEAVLSDRTRWVAVTAASNAVGTVPDLPGIVAAARRVGARVYVDAVHASPHRPLDVAALGVDALACSAYKWFGPHIGMLCARAGAARGAHAGQAAPVLRRGARPLGARDAAVRVARRRARRGRVRARRSAGRTSRARGRAARGARSPGSAAIDGVTLYGDARDRTPTLMFNVEGIDAREVAAALAEREIAVWDGNYYAWELERHLGLAPDGAVRAGLRPLQRRRRRRAAARRGRASSPQR